MKCSLLVTFDMTYLHEKLLRHPVCAFTYLCMCENKMTEHKQHLYILFDIYFYCKGGILK